MAGIARLHGAFVLAEMSDFKVIDCKWDLSKHEATVRQSEPSASSVAHSAGFERTEMPRLLAAKIQPVSAISWV